MGVGVEAAHHVSDEVEFFGAQEVALVEHDHIGELDLLGEQVGERAFVIFVGDLAALAQDL